MSRVNSGGVPGRAVSASQRALFLESLSKLPSVTAACVAAGFARRTAYEMRDRDPDFGKEWADALEQSTDIMLGAIWSRTLHGVPKMVVSMGQIVNDPETGKPLVEFQYQDGIGMQLLKAHRPEVYSREAGAVASLPVELMPDPAPTPDEPVPDEIIE